MPLNMTPASNSACSPSSTAARPSRAPSPGNMATASSVNVFATMEACPML